MCIGSAHALGQSFISSKILALTESPCYSFIFHFLYYFIFFFTVFLDFFFLFFYGVALVVLVMVLFLVSPCQGGRQYIGYDGD
jgi:hypothetical protein